MDASNKPTISVQHVNKKSSDELLRKFANDEPSPTPGRIELRSAKRRKSGDDSCESPFSHCRLAERRSLLPPAASKYAILRQFRMGRLRVRARGGIKHKSLFGTIEKTWCRTVEGASRMFMEKHYNRHRRLINDVV